MTLLEKIEASAAARLVLPQGVLPAQELGRYKRFLKVETHRLKILHRAGAPGLEICRARAAILDVLLRYILEGIKNGSPAMKGAQMPVMALVAIGGYGRAELNPQSDIDIMFLHDGSMMVNGKARPSLSALVDGLLYTLWDLGFKVGHSVRSIDDCVNVANEDMQSKTSLIEARRILGDEALFDRFTKTLVAKCVKGSENEYIQARLQDQEMRRSKFGNSACMQEPNIKNGCGGLRDYQNLLWMAFFKGRMRTVEDLVGKGVITSQERKQLENAYDFLLRTRNELHYLVERPVDVLSKGVQPVVASNLGFHDRSPSRRVEKFMRVYYMHARNIDLITRMTERRLALVPEPNRMQRLRQIFRSKQVPEQTVDGLKFVDGEMHPVGPGIFRESPRRLMRLFLHAQQRGLKMHPDLAQLVGRNLRLVDNAFLKDEHVRKTFLEILNQRGNVARVVRLMHEVGLLGKFIPEFGRLTCLVQHDFYHQYTADEHTLICLEKLDQVWNATTPPYSEYSELFRELERPYLLYLALLLHDSGKGVNPGHHEIIGGQNALRVARRLGLDGSETHTLRLVIENHLAMAQISQRRDLDDDGVIRSFARIIQTVENLSTLTLHTFADSMATSDQLWNGFKDTGLWRLQRRTRDLLTGATEFRVAEERQRDLLVEEVQRMAPATFDPAEVQAHIHNLPPRYSQINDAKDVLRDVMQVHRFIRLQLTAADENALSPIISWRNEPDRGYSTVTICTWDRERLFSSITGCLTAAGLNILGADILTRADRVIIDSFIVTDARTALPAAKVEQEKFEALAHKVLTGAPVDLRALITRTKAAPSIYKSIDGERIPTVIEINNEISEDRSVIDVQTEDRVGLLYDISRALASLHLNLSLANIVTEKGAAIDSFYATEFGGGKILDPDRVTAIKQKLRQAIAQAA